MSGVEVTKDGKSVTIHAVTLDGTKIHVSGTLQANGDILDDDGKVWRIIDSDHVTGEDAKQ